MGNVTGSRLKVMTRLVLLAGALSGASAFSVRAQEAPGGRRTLQRHASVPAPTAGAFQAADTAAIARRWGLEVKAMRLAESGYMLEFRYRILDAAKAQPLFSRKTKPTLRDEVSGLDTAVPNPPTTGALRSTNDAKAGRTYFMFFANPGRLIKAGNTVTVTIGDFVVSGIPVTDDSAPPTEGNKP
jgi:hypothetical protein